MNAQRGKRSHLGDHVTDIADHDTLG
jgi:hypothetical protein